MCLSVCIIIMSRSIHPMTSRVAGVLLRTQGSAVSHFGAIWTHDTFRINKLQNSASVTVHNTREHGDEEFTKQRSLINPNGEHRTQGSRDVNFQSFP